MAEKITPAQKRKKVEKEAASEIARKLLARRDLVAFAEYVIRDPTGKKIKAAPIHRSWVDHFYYCWEIAKAGVILAPYGHGKTAWLGLALPLWLLGLNPNFRIMVVSSAEEIAAKRIQKIEEYIERSPEYNAVFPWVKRDRNKPWNNHVMSVMRSSAEDGGITGSVDYSVAAFGYTSSEGQGSRTDCIIFDDVCDEKNSRLSAAARKNVISLVSSQWISRAANAPPVYTRDGKFISETALICAIGTRFHIEDLYGFWMGAPDGFCTMIQGISEDFTHLDVEVIGSLDNPKHPILTQYKNYIPTPPVEEDEDETTDSSADEVEDAELAGLLDTESTPEGTREITIPSLC